MQVSAVISGGTRDWHLGNHLKDAAARAGLDLDSMDQAIADPASHREEVEAYERDVEKCGHWGVPTFEFNGEPFSARTVSTPCARGWRKKG